MAFEFKLPDIGEGVVEGEIVTWLVQEGERIHEDQPLVEVMTDKATVEIHSPKSGIVVRRLGAEGDVVPVGATLVVIDDQGDAANAPQGGHAAPSSPPQPKEKHEVPPAVPAQPPARAQTENILATPAIRKRARELGVDLSAVKGSGPGGRITEQDLQRPESKAPAGTPADERVPLRGVRRKIAERMSRSKHLAAHFTYVEELDVTLMVQAQKQGEREAVARGKKLTYLPFIIQAVAAALRKYPMMNASLDEERQEIIVKKRINLGIAAATDQGLVVPVLKDAEGRTLWELADEVHRLAEDARHQRSPLQDLQDSTFTITSLGALGGILATPIINYPEVAILGIHKIQVLPRYVEGDLQPRHVMNISLSVDHRVVDGWIAAQFAAEIKTLLESLDPGSPDRSRSNASPPHA